MRVASFKIELRFQFTAVYGAVLRRDGWILIGRICTAASDLWVALFVFHVQALLGVTGEFQDFSARPLVTSTSVWFIRKQTSQLD
jgi:hypothetical protein